MAVDDIVTQFDLNPSDVVDRINNPDVLTADQYQNRLVDFYRQSLGSTGIQTTKPAEDEDEKKDYVAPKIIDDGSDADGDDNLFAGVGRDAGKESKSIESVLDFKTNNKTLEIMNLNLPSSYSEHLEKNNKDDKADLSKYQKSFNDQSSKLHANVNKNLQKNFKVGIDFPDAKQAQKYGITTMIGSALGANPFVTSLVGSAVAGKTQTNIKGGQSFKPSGMFGIVEDVSQSLELEALRTNQTAYQKHKLDHQMKFGGDPLIHGFDKPEFNFDNYVKSKDIGFSFDVGGNNMTSVYRTAGSKIYNGAMYDMTQEQARRLEALGKGKAIFYDGKMFDPTNPENSSDLVTTDKEGGYDEKGNFHDARFGVSATGRARNRDNLAKEIFGVVNTKTQNLTDKALSIARNQKGGLSKALKEQLNIYRPTTTARTQGSSGDDRQDDTKDDQVDQQTYKTETATLSTKKPTHGAGFFRDDGNDDGGFTQEVSDTFGDTGEGDFSPVAMGGRIGMSNGGNTTEVVQPAGFIAPDPNATDQQEIADDKPMDAKNGDFIINAPAAKDAGKQDIQRMINTAITNLQERGVDVRFGNPKINTADNVKLLVSRNEVYIPAVIAKEIGYDRLKKINNRGKREVQRRQEESQQEEKPQARGFIQKKKGDVIKKPKYKNPSSYIDMIAFATGVYGDSQKAAMDSRQYSIDYKTKDNDKSEDSLRHILGGGYMADSVFKKLGSFGYDVREFGAFMEELFNQDKDPLNEESRIDLNNNRYGRALRKLYPDEKKFKNKAIEIVTNLSQGKKVPSISGISPMLSLGIAEQNKIFDIRKKRTNYPNKQN